MSNLTWRRTAKRKQPIRSVRPGQLTRSNQSSRVHQEAMACFSANQIHQMENPQDRMVRIGESTRSDGQNQRIHKIGWSESYRPIISLEQLFHRYIMVTFFGESTRSDGQNRRIYKIGWSESYRPIIWHGLLFNRYKWSQSLKASTRSDGQNHIGQSNHSDSYWTVISRSQSSENLQDRMFRIVSANHITEAVI